MLELRRAKMPCTCFDKNLLVYLNIFCLASFYFLIFLLAMIALAIPVTILVMCSENTWRKTAEANK